MSTARILKVAIIGTGEVAMCIHLPTLGLMSHMFEVTALVDVSKQALEYCSRKFNVPRTFTDLGDMLDECPEVELVIMCHSDEFHSADAIQCLHAGRNLFIEKPMAQTLKEADDIEAARLASGKVVFVGHMRRYATAFLRTKKIVHELESGDINYVRIRNFTSRVKNGIISQNGTFPERFTDFPPEASTQKNDIGQRQFEELTGLEFSAPVSEHIRACRFHISPHDLSLMRELFGVPQSVITAVPNARGNFIAVLFQYDGFVLAYESGQDEVLSVDATVDICTQQKRIKLAFNSPYIKGLPITATILSRHPNGDHSEETIRPTYEDYYTLQFRELYSCLVDGAAVKTTVQDSREDIVLTSDIYQALAEGFQKRERSRKN